MRTKLFVIAIVFFSLLFMPQIMHGQISESPSPNTMFSFSVSLRGIGTDGNAKPIRMQRMIVVDVYNSQNQLVVTRVGKVTYDAQKGLFDGEVSIGLLQPGEYTVKLKTSSYLQKTAPGIVTIRQGGGLYQIHKVTLVSGDVTNDNQTNILDYNVLMGCYSDLAPAKKCTATVRDMTDFNDDGKVNQYDYNLFLRELSNRSGE